MVAHGALGIAIGLALYDGVAFINHVLAFGQTDPDFNSAPDEVALQRNNGQPLFTRFAMQLLNFFTVQQQLPLAGLVMIVNIAMIIGLNRAANQVGLQTIVHMDVALLNTDMTLLAGFHLSTG